MNDFDGVLNKLFSAKNVLLMTHRRPDGDALGSTFGMQEVLRGCGISAEIILPDGMPARFTGLCGEYLKTISRQDAEKFDLFVALDCANPERLGCGDELNADMLRQKNFVSVDHHKGNSLAAPCQWVKPDACSASFMAAELAIASGKPLPAAAATFFMTGIMTDTGSFCFANTDAATFRTAAVLMERGADVQKIANAIFFSKPLNQLNFEAELISNCIKTACGGKFAYAFIPEALLQKYNFDMREDEGLIDIVRGIDTAVVAMLCHRRSDGFRISLRSKDSRFPVGPIARELGGGGHDMAAGCTVDLPEFADAEALILARVSQLFN